MSVNNLIIINPVSVKKNKVNINFDRYFPFYKMLTWDSPDIDICKLIKDELQKEKYDNLIALGGDGTVNRAAQAIVNSDLILGIVPLGSGNGLARHLKIPMNIDKSIQLILEGKTKKIDACKINDIFFFCTSGVGFDAHIGKLFAKSKTRGFKTYFKIVASQFFKYECETYELIFDGKTISTEAFLITFANANQYGNNTYIAPNADICDGKIDIVILKPFKFINSPVIALRLFNKTIDKSRFISTFRSGEIILKRKNPGIAHFDGDPCILPEELKIINIPSALKVYSNLD